MDSKLNTQVYTNAVISKHSNGLYVIDSGHVTIARDALAYDQCLEDVLLLYSKSTKHGLWMFGMPVTGLNDSRIVLSEYQILARIQYRQGSLTMSMLPGYAWDGGTDAPKQSQALLVASSGHDLDYQMLRCRVRDQVSNYRILATKLVFEELRKQADTCFYDVLQSFEDSFIHKTMYYAVRMFGAKFARPGSESTPVLEHIKSL